MIKRFAPTAICIALFAGLVMTQWAYDAQRVKQPTLKLDLSPALIRSVDLGLHSALASLFWVPTRAQLPFLRSGAEIFKEDFDLVTALDPKFSTPYAFATLVIPSIKKYPNAVDEAIAIGKLGVAQGDPDWHTPFYLATIYHIEKRDYASAMQYFDMAGKAPNAPENIRLFAEGYTLAPTLRGKTQKIWEAIYLTSTDPEARDRAKKYLIRIELFDILEQAAIAYKAKVGVFPKTPADLVTKGLIPGIPKDPFDYSIRFNSDGTVHIDPPKEEVSAPR